MARVTVEDCVEKIPNRFELVMMAAQRARNLGAGAPMTLEQERDKVPVIALREIAAETVKIPDIRESLVRSLRKIPDSEEPDLEALGIMNEEINMPVGQESVGDDEGGSANVAEDAESIFRPKSTGLYADQAVDLERELGEELGDT